MSRRGFSASASPQAERLRGNTAADATRENSGDSKLARGLPGQALLVLCWEVCVCVGGGEAGIQVTRHLYGQRDRRRTQGWYKHFLVDFLCEDDGQPLGQLTPIKAQLLLKERLGVLEKLGRSQYTQARQQAYINLACVHVRQ